MSNLTSSTSTPDNSVWKTLAEFSLPSQLNSNELIQEQAISAVQGMNLSLRTIERLKNAVAEAVLNVIEHNYRYQADLPILIRILVLEQSTSIDGLGQDNEPTPNVQTLELKCKTSGGPARRGWGFFLIHKLGEELTYPGETHYTLELFLYQEDD